MPVVTLTTDFGNNDFYLPLLKGAILSKNDSVQLIDISHNIKNYDIVQGAFIFKHVYQSFPKNTVHLISVHDYYDKNPQFVVIRHHEQYFIGPDNGIFWLIFDGAPDEVYLLENKISSSFPLKEIYANAIEHVLSNNSLEHIGKANHELVQRITFQPVSSTSRIRGTIIYIDNYDNAITNIHKDLFLKVANERSFELYFKRNDPIKKLSELYADVPVGEVLCRFNAANLLEIAVHAGKAASLLGLKLDDAVQIDFKVS